MMNLGKKSRKNKKYKGWSPQIKEAAVNESAGIVARFDGSCWPNPGGDASCACVVKRDGEEVYRLAHYLGKSKQHSNNVAEFAGVVLILNWIVDNHVLHPVQIVGDSQIVIRRMRSQTLPEGFCASMAKEALCRLRECRNEVTFHWQPREHNDTCDALADTVMPDRRPWGRA